MEHSTESGYADGRFSLPGKENVSREWKLVCAASNLLKLFRAGGVPEIAKNRGKRAHFTRSGAESSL
jgi:hypothetical protein